jgi:DnaK suppressor protein
VSLTAEQRGHLERRLQEERTRVTRALDRSVETQTSGTEQDRAGELTLAPLHQADLGTDAMRGELDASNATRLSLELAEIDAALDRLYQQPERFGICEDTGEEIPYERLELIPWARTCGQAG